MKHLLEIAVFNTASARIADQAGADRIELCSDLSAGGLTPSVDAIIQAKQELNCPFFVMIRPKAGGFVYTPTEVAKMKEDLLLAKEHGVSGFVFGILKEDGTVDEAANKALVALAHPLPCTFHRAFDAITDKPAALEALIACGFQRVLTSGGVGNAIDYCDVLQQLIIQANGRIIIMPGGGVRSNNISKIMEKIDASEYHSAAITDGGADADPLAVGEMKALLSED
jgi:copper homeostasis protein